MRKAILTVGAACLLASVMASSAVASPSTYQHFEAKVFGKAGTAKKPGSVGSYLKPFHDLVLQPQCLPIALNSTKPGCAGNEGTPGDAFTRGLGSNGGALAELPFATLRARIYFPKELKLATAGFPTCKSDVVLKTPTKCPKGSKIGAGVANGFARGKSACTGCYTLAPQLTVQVFVLSTKSIALRTYSSATKEAIIEGVISKYTGSDPKYGSIITFSLPKGLIEPIKGVMSQLAAFDSTIAAVKNKKGKPLQSLVGCPANKQLTFGYNSDYNVKLDKVSSPKYVSSGEAFSINETGPIVTSTVPCKK